VPDLEAATGVAREVEALGKSDRQDLRHRTTPGTRAVDDGKTVSAPRSPRRVSGDPACGNGSVTGVGGPAGGIASFLRVERGSCWRTRPPSGTAGSTTCKPRPRYRDFDSAATDDSMLLRANPVKARGAVLRGYRREAIPAGPPATPRPSRGGSWRPFHEPQ